MAMLQADELAAHLRLRRCIVKSTATSPATNVVETQRGKQGPTATVNIMTWNILADCYVRVKNQPWNAFAHCADEHLSWAARRPKIERILAATMADVIALQEVVFEERTGIPEMNEEHEQECFWRAPAWLVHLAHKNGLSVELQKLSQKEFNKNALRNERAVNRRTPTGLVTLYKSSRFMLEGSKHSSGSGSVLYLRDKESNYARLSVGNIHLVGDPSKQAAQISQLKGIAKAFARDPGAAKILCGDFNGECGADSAVLDWTVSQHLVEAQTDPTWAEPGHVERLDHIFFEASSGQAAVKQVCTLHRPSVESMLATGLPNADMPSDHCPVQLILELGPAVPVSQPSSIGGKKAAVPSQVPSRGYSKSRVKGLGKKLVQLLRHQASETDGLTLRSDGYVLLESILKTKHFSQYSVAEVELAVSADNKSRMLLSSIDGKVFIRANQGHTMKGIDPDKLLTPIVDPKEVPVSIHGTYKASLPAIMKAGLNRMGRNHVHLTNGHVSEVKSGVRKNVEILIYVDVAKAMGRGLKFYRSENNVILCPGPIPADCFEKVVHL